MDYKTNVVCTSNYGKYAWCSNYQESGYFLTNNNEIPYSLMIKLLIDIDDTLKNKIDIIQCYDCTGFLIQYTTKSIDNHMELFFTDRSNTGIVYNNKPDLQNTYLTIKYIKWLPRDPNKLNRLCPPPADVIYQEKILIPTITVYNFKDCAICLESSNEFISECGHPFHTECLFSYLKTNNRLKHLSSHCFKYCKHGKKPYLFNCPTCRTLIT
jgi:hypothetical protein